MKSMNINKNPVSLIDIARRMGCDYATIAKGDGMAALITSGSIVFGRELFNIPGVPKGKIYILKTKEQEFIRYVHNHPTDKESFLLKSYNKKHPYNKEKTPYPIKSIIRIFEYRLCVKFA